MKRLIIILSIFILGFALGATYGWWTGFTDGAIESRLYLTAWLPESRALATDNVLQRRLDGLAASSAVIFAAGHSYSPLAFITHPKADGALLDMLAYRETFAPELSLEDFYSFGSFGFLQPTPRLLTKDEFLQSAGSATNMFSARYDSLLKSQAKIKNEVEQGAVSTP